MHVPVALYPASSETGIDFDWLDKRSMDPVGYKRINKRTGREIAGEHIVRGIKVDGGDYVVLGDDEISAAYPKTTQTIEIEAFAHATEIPFTHLEKPFYLEPAPKAEKVYALLREAMLAAGVIGIARVVMHTKEHLAALVPAGPLLMLNTLRWADEIRPQDQLKVPPAGKVALKDAELKMAVRLIKDMTEAWQPERYADKFTAAVHALVRKRVEAGKTEQVQALEEASPMAASNVLDLTELLQRSLGSRKTTAPRTAAPAAKKLPRAAAKKSSAGAARKRA